MSDDRKNILQGLGDLDWDSALDEWEKNTFDPAVAPDRGAPANVDAAAPEPPAIPAGDPVEEDLSGEAAIADAIGAALASVQPQAPPPPSSPALSARRPEGTLIAPVPRELRSESSGSLAPSGEPGAERSFPPTPPPVAPPAPPSRPSSPPSIRGGLDQLFSRPRTTSSKPQLPVPRLPSRPPSDKTRTASPAPWSPADSRDRVSAPRDVAPADALLASERESEHTLVKAPQTDRMRNAPPIPEQPPAPAQLEGSPTDARATALADPSGWGAAVPPDDETEERPFLAPRARERDDNGADGATMLRDRGSLSDADTATRHPADELPTAYRPSNAPEVEAEAHGFPLDASETTRWKGDLRVPERGDTSLDDEKAKALKSRIAWLEEEARMLADPVAQARALLSVSELSALVGDRERALAFATEARDLAPQQVPLAWRQMRQLMAWDPETIAAALDAEAHASPTPSARAHATLLAADVLRINALGDAAVERWESACKLDPADPRAPIARAALALAQNDHTSSALRIADNSELISLDRAIATALRLRGVERAGAEFDEMPINDGLRHARAALAEGDIVAASQAVNAMAAVPEISKAALWLSSALGASHIASRRASARSLKTLASEGDPLARRQLAARGIELGDPELVMAALETRTEGSMNPFDAAERTTLPILASKGEATESFTPKSLGLGADRELAALEDALLSLAPRAALEAGAGPDEKPVAVDRAERTAGKPEARAQATLGRLLACEATDDVIEDALHAIEHRTASASGVAIEAAVRAKRWAELSEVVSDLPGGESSTERHVAAAILAERARDRERAKEAWSAAARTSTQHEGIVRIAADLDREVDLGSELLRIADPSADGLGAAILRLEALARSSMDDDAAAVLLERVHRAAPQLGIGAFLAERVGRRNGELDEVLRWIQERRSYANGPLETALDAVREALLVADRDPELASTRLEEAHRARPDDVALRELHERLAPEPPPDRGSWREARAARASATDGSNAALLWIEAALEHERAGDVEGMLRAARKAAEAGDRGLSSPLIERGELALGDTMQQTDELLEVMKDTEDPKLAREALERLAILDAFGKSDLGAAMLWHRSILESTPDHKPSLQWVEHALLGEGRDEELTPIFEQIALALDGTGGGEVTAHAQHAARLRAREAALASSANRASDPPTHARSSNAWERTHDLARLAATQPEPSLWALRALNAHARLLKDDSAILMTTVSLLERTQRPAERASLLLRASESAARLEQVSDARAFLEQAVTEDPGDVVTWGFLAEIRERTNDARLAAEACESLARTSVVPEHQLLAWHDASKLWGELKDHERSTSALEAAAEIDVTYADVFPRLSALYADKRLDSELARLLERRLATIQDDDERVALEVELSRAFAEMGELSKAKASLESALEKRPDHATALSAMADLCAKEGDWAGAEQAYVRLGRLLTDPAEQKVIYEQLGELYAVHSPNLSRAELAYREVLKRSPGDLAIQTKLVDIFKRQGDVARAVEGQQEIIAAAADPDARLSALVELAKIYEDVGRDPRRSEQVLDSTRKEFPTSVVALRAMAEFYARQRQLPAMQILLDRAAGDARRAFAQGRFVPSLFQVLHAAFELRNKRDAARVVAATLAAALGQESELMGGEARAVDPRLDDLLAPEAMSPPLRALLFRAGDALDAAAPVDLRAVKATPLPPGTPIGATVGSVATVVGLGALQILLSPTLGRVAIPLSTNPPTLLVGEGLAKVKNESARMFVVVRAMKMILGRSSALLRGTPQDVSSVVAALLCAFNPSYIPQNVDQKRVSDLARRITPALGRNVDPTIGVIALEAAGVIGAQWHVLAPAAVAWANRVALLAVGDPNAALDALAWGYGEDAAPTGSEERAAWISRHAEARELMTFSVTDAYAEARMRLGLDR